MTREQQVAIITEAARRIGTNPAWLDALINFETGGTYDPLQPSTVKNEQGDPVAWGLIQFRDVAARDMHYANAYYMVHLFPDFEGQMYNLVVPYFKMKAQQNRIPKYDTLQSLTMAVYWPVYWNVEPDTLFPERIRSDTLSSPKDYMKFVVNRLREGEFGDIAAPFTIPTLAIMAGVGIVVWLIWRNR